MPASPPDAAAHRRRVLEHLEKQSDAETAAPSGADPQTRIPLIVEVTPAPRPQPKRKRRRGRAGGSAQPELDGL
jgi:hypothetical protein